MRGIAASMLARLVDRRGRRRAAASASDWNRSGFSWPLISGGRLESAGIVPVGLRRGAGPGGAVRRASDDGLRRAVAVDAAQIAAR